MESIVGDLRFGLRLLLKNRGFTVVAVLAIALGIGANTAIFSIVNAVVLRPLPYNDTDRLVMAGTSLPDFHDIEAGSHAFDATAVFASNLFNVAGTEAGDQIRGGTVSGTFFPMLGGPLLGRTIGPEDRDRVAVLSFAYWQRRYGGDPTVLGRSITLSNQTYTIVGVMPRDFQFPSSDYMLWVPIEPLMAEAPEQANNRSLRIFRVVAHLAPGVTAAQAQKDVDRIAADLEQRYPDTNEGVRVTLTPVYDRIVGPVRPALLVLLGAVGLVLLIACANVANLLLARTTAREREMAVRLALGAGRWRVARQLLAESALLAAMGGAAGLILAAWLLDVIPLVDAGIPRVAAIRLDGAVLLFTAGATALTGVLFGLAPAFQSTRADLGEALKASAKGVVAPRARRLRSALVVLEVALSVVVLIGAGLLLRSFERLASVDPGFEPEHLVAFNVSLGPSEAPERRAVLAAEVIERVARVPGVEVVGGGTGLPPVNAQRATRFAADGVELGPDDDGAYFFAVTPDYFRALRTPLVTGRAFDARDSRDAERVVILNESLARKLYGVSDPIGRRIRLVNPEQEPGWRTVVGVVGDVRYSGLDDPGGAAVYTPFSQTPFLWTNVMVRTQLPAQALAGALQTAVTSVDGRLSAARVTDVSRLVSETVAQPRFNAFLLASFAGLALALAVIGIYGVVSYSVAQRTREIGIRMALGARASDVLRHVVGQGLGLAAAGAAVGVVASLVASRVLESQMFEVSTTDPATFAAVPLMFLAVALAASYVPARRAARVDPAVALRNE